MPRIVTAPFATIVLQLSAFVGAVVCFVCAAWVARGKGAIRRDRAAGVVTLACAGVWCVCVAAFGPAHRYSAAAEVARNLAWIFALFRLFANDGRDESLALVRPAVIAIAFAEVLQIGLLSARFSLASHANLLWETSAVLRLLVAVGALMLVHNLYLGAAQQSRVLLRWNVAALLGFWAFTLNYHTLGWLLAARPQALDTAHSAIVAVAALGYAFGFNQVTAGLQFRPSRIATFRFLSLLVIAGYVVAVALMTRWLGAIPREAARLVLVGLVVTASVLMLAWLPSRKMRGWLRVTALKHLFKHRYDYRTEWLRFTQTIARGEQPQAEALPERAVRALADLTDSPGGLLFTPEDDGTFTCAARFGWPERAAGPASISSAFAQLIEREAIIVDFDALRKGQPHRGEDAVVPPWMCDCRDVWAAVPLMHFDRLVGIVILARPAYTRTLDWEDFDILGIVGRQLASYLAEQAGQAALLEASRFDEFNRRMAFVMHDIKNLSSQLSLLTRNAERHADKPEFQRDMLLTVRNSADKLNTLLARLGRYGTGPAQDTSPFDLRATVVAVTKRFSGQYPVALVRNDRADVVGLADGLEQALGHLIQNAIDASAADSAVTVEAFSDGLHGIVTVSDNGCGMSPAFVRDGLFKPFVSSKESGFGIGAYEAREIIRAMGGRLDVESREGLGTRFTISLPLRSAQHMLATVEPWKAEAA